MPKDKMPIKNEVNNEDQKRSNQNRKKKKEITEDLLMRKIDELKSRQEELVAESNNLNEIIKTSEENREALNAQLTPTPVETQKIETRNEKIEEAKKALFEKMEAKDEAENTESTASNENPAPDEETLEQKEGMFTLTGEDINTISQKIKDKLYLTPEERALYEKNPALFESAVKTHSRSYASYLASGYLWLQKQFLTTPKGETVINTPSQTQEKKQNWWNRLFSKKEKIVLTNEEIAEHQNETNAQSKENLTEPQTAKKLSQKEIKEQEEQAFIKKVTEKIKFELENASNKTAEEKGNLAKEIYLREKQVFDNEKLEKAGTIKKSIEGANKWWDKLDPRWKVALSSTLVAGTVVGTGLYTGDIKSIASAGFRFASKVGIATGLSSALSSNNPKSFMNTMSAENRELLNKSKYLLTGLGIGASFLAGGWVAGSIALGGYGARKIVNFAKEKYAKKREEMKANADKELTSADFNDKFDANKLENLLKEYNSAYDNAIKAEKNAKFWGGITNYALSSTAGILAMHALSPKVEHGTEDHDKNPIPNEDKPSETGTNPPVVPNQPPEANKVEFLEVKAGDGVTQTLKRLVEEHKAPKWVMDELGKNPKSSDYAHFAEKYGMLHPHDANDSIMVSKGDSFGFDEKGDFIWKHGNQEFNVVKIDDHGHHEEGDWLDKMQDEKFIHSGGGHATPETGTDHSTEGGGPTVLGETGNEGNHASESSSSEGPKTDTAESQTGDHSLETAPKAGDEGSQDAGNSHAETTPVSHNTNPYELTSEQLEYTGKVYQNTINEIFKTEKGVNYWQEIATSNKADKSAFGIMNFKIIGDADGNLPDPNFLEQNKFIEFLQKIKSVTGLEPTRPTLTDRSIPWENCKDYITRGMQYAYKNNKLNEISL